MKRHREQWTGGDNLTPMLAGQAVGVSELVIQQYLIPDVTRRVSDLLPEV